MNAGALKLSVAATMLGLAACAGTPAREDPHHYSKDRDGNRIACYATQAANEYECVPVVRQYPHEPYGYPYWPSVSFGLHYGWPHYYYGHFWYPYPAYRYPPPHYRPRRR